MGNSGGRNIVSGRIGGEEGSDTRIWVLRFVLRELVGIYSAENLNLWAFHSLCGNEPSSVLKYWC